MLILERIMFSFRNQIKAKFKIIPHIWFHIKIASKQNYFKILHNKEQS